MEEKYRKQERIKLLIEKYKQNKIKKDPINEKLTGKLREKLREKLKEKCEKPERPKTPHFTMKDVHYKYTDEELLDSIDIEKIDLYLRKKKLNKLKNNISK